MIFERKATQHAPLQKYFIGMRIALLAEHREVKTNFLQQRNASDAKTMIKAMLKRVKCQLKAINLNRLHFENITHERDIEEASGHGDVKSAWKSA